MVKEKIKIDNLESGDVIWIREYNKYLTVKNVDDECTIEFECGKIIFSGKNRKFKSI